GPPTGGGAPPPRRASRRPSRSGIRRRRGRAGTGGSRVSCPAGSPRRRAAGSGPGARSRRTCAPRRSPSCARSAPATSPPATSPCRVSGWSQLRRAAPAQRFGYRGLLQVGRRVHGAGGKRWCRPPRIPLPSRPVPREGALAALDQGEDLLAGRIDLDMERVIDQPEPSAVGVFVFVFPRIASEVGLDYQVQQQVEGVDTDRGAPVG